MGNNKYKYYSKRDGRYAPTNEAQRRMNSEIVGSYTDSIMRQRNKKPPEKGLRTQFLEKHRECGYEVAKEFINSKFRKEDDEKEAFSDEILKEWIEEEKRMNNRVGDDDAR